MATASIPSPLADFVDATVLGPVPQARVDHLPDGRTRLIFRLLPDGQADLHVAGPRRRAVYKRATPCTAFVMFVFQPGGGYPFFGVPLAELVDRTLPLRDLWRAFADEVLERLVVAPTDHARITVLERALSRRMQGPHAFEPFAAPVVRRAVARLTDQPRTTLAALARDLNLSDRSLRRTFPAVVGLSPKHYERIVRFQRAIAGAAQARSMSELATANGYFDQAHLCADFREFARLSPTALRRQDATDALRNACA